MHSWSFPRTPENSRGGVEAEQSCAEISTDRKKIDEPSRTREAISKRPDSDYRINLIKKGKYSTRPEQQQQQEEEEENEFDEIQLLWIEPEASEQLKF